MCARVYRAHSPTLDQRLLDVVEVLEIVRRRQLYAKSSKCEFGVFGRQELASASTNGGRGCGLAHAADRHRSVEGHFSWRRPRGGDGPQCHSDTVPPH